MLDQAAAMTADKLVGDAINDMLGRPGRGESLGILRATFDGDAATALAQFARLHKNGAEAEMVVADLLNIIHLVVCIILLNGADFILTDLECSGIGVVT